MAEVRVGNHRAFERRLAAMRETASGATEQAAIYRDIGLPIVQGLAAFQRGDYAQTVEHLLPARFDLWKMGGSRAQRDVIDWTLAHENTLKALASAGLNDDGEGNVKAPKKVLDQIKQENEALVNEGLQYLNQALANRSNYDDAMSYLNRTYRRKADVDYADPAAVKADVAAAKDWSSKAMGTRKANEEKKDKGPGGITMDSSGNLK